MKNLIFTTLLILSVISVQAQSTDLEITWSVTEPNYQNSNQALSVLKLKNLGETDLPASGWVIYYNSLNGKLQNPESAPVTITYINGDFYSLSPKSGFKALKPGEELDLPILTRQLKNLTDYPKGFYIAFTGTKRTFPVKLKQNTTEDLNARDLAIARSVYDKTEKTMAARSDSFSPILPTPKSMVKKEGSFSLSGQSNLVVPKEFIAEAKLFLNDLQVATGIKPQLNGKAKENQIIVQQLNTIKPEAYNLHISPKEIKIQAATKAGVFYAFQSLKALLPLQKGTGSPANIAINALEINDEPRFGHRAFMMDIARNYQPKDEVKKLIEALALYKVNVLHFHITDDEGWRLEIPGLPELTQVGGHRGHTTDENDQINPSYGSGPNRDNLTGSGYLTKNEFIEILKFAHERHILVIPEIETPGHARAAIVAMNARYNRLIKSGNKTEAEKYLLRDLQDKSVYRSVQGFKDNVINAALPSVYTFLEKVTDELIAMYKTADAPLKTIHFGGDEVPAGVWEKSPVVLSLMRKNPSVKNTGQLWPYYFNKLDQMLKRKGLYLSGWEEIGLHKVKGKMVVNERFAKSNFHTDVWNNLSGNEDLAYRLANAGYKVVLTNVTNLYLDLAYSKSYAEPGQYWGGYVDIDKPFSFIPYNYTKNQKEDERGNAIVPGHFKNMVQLTEFGKSNIVGIQAPLWSEIIFSKERFEYLLFPKLFGLAERAWAQDPTWALEKDAAKSEAQYNAAYQSFLNSVGNYELPRLDNLSGGFNYRIPTPGLKVENGTLSANVLYPGLTIVYTTDGSEPNENSQKYTAPISQKGNYTFKTINAKGRGSNLIKVQL